MRIASHIRLVGVSAAILWGVVGVSRGLAQQSVGLPSGEIDCAYRVQLLRDRVVALTQRSPSDRATDPQDHVVSNLIRETRTACANRGDLESEHALEAIDLRLREHLESRSRDQQARRELLAP
ncbi:MAG: hypothetical protein IPH07_04780 [Deltaproteobacteria bacterium]|nr:hypothetical protein [Deltaproteobacteria bacterium]MBK8237686.1 hypothetical protein [Deltaproteobacteria bacterium]MBK8719436.1 hypothetical protein [Deltaproteobacteria bacterium]MBP7292088.1 hypothetical protein [Nannocystaceae bacterium]